MGVSFARNAQLKFSVNGWLMVDSERKIYGHVPASCAGGFLVSILKRVPEIKARGKSPAITQAYASPNACERAGCVIDHATRIVVVADPAEIKKS